MGTYSNDTLNQEWILLKENALWYNSRYHAQTGTLVLSSNRITFKKHASPVTGIFKKLFFTSNEVRLTHNIPFEKIKRVSNASIGINKNLLIISTIDNKIIKFSVKDYNRWKEQIFELTQMIR